MSNAASAVQGLVAVWGIKVLAAVLIVVIGRWAAAEIKKLIGGLMRRSKVDETLISFVSSLAYVGVMAFVVIAALSKLGIQTASFVVVLGAAGLAVGLALQGSLANFAAGVLMIIFKPFKVGDFIEAAGTTGTVDEISIFTTQLKTPDNKKVIIPNAKITGDNITNFTANDTRRLDLVACVSYGDDLDRVQEVLGQILSEEPRLLQDPAPTIGVLEMADSSVNIAVRPWVKTGEYWDIYFDLQKKIKQRFDKEGISIPFPQQDVHLHQAQG
jgi:small conductance mechanosensitive channel